MKRTLRALRKFWVEGEIRGLLPPRIRRFRVVDTPQQWEDGLIKFPAGAGMGTRVKMVRLPDVPPAETFSGKMDEQAWQAK